VLDVNGLEPFDYVYGNGSGKVGLEFAASLDAFAVPLDFPGYASAAAASIASHDNFYVDDNSAITVLNRRRRRQHLPVRPGVRHRPGRRQQRAVRRRCGDDRGWRSATRTSPRRSSSPAS